MNKGRARRVAMGGGGGGSSKKQEKKDPGEDTKDSGKVKNASNWGNPSGPIRLPDMTKFKKKPDDRSKNRTRSVSRHGTHRKKEDDFERKPSQAELHALKIKDKIAHYDHKLIEDQQNYDCKLRQHIIAKRAGNEMHPIPGVFDRAIGDLSERSPKHWLWVADDCAKMLNGDLKKYIIEDMAKIRKYYELLPNKKNIGLLNDWEIQVAEYEELHKELEEKVKTVGAKLDDITDTEENKEKRYEVDLELEDVDVQSYWAKYKAAEYKRKIKYVTGASTEYKIQAHSHFSP